MNIDEEPSGVGWQWKIINAQRLKIKELESDIKRNNFAVTMARKTIEKHRDKHLHR